MHHLSPEDLNILLVEPSDVQRKLIMRHLRDEGIGLVEEASNMEAAFEILNDHIPDLVISAMHLTEGSSMEMLKKIRSTDGWSDIPFMLISSETRKSQLEEYKQCGVVAILPKPFDRVQFGKAINATLDLLNPAEMDLGFFDVQDLRVLVVDDSRMARNHISRVLTNLGIQRITQAENGQEAIDILSGDMFDLVVTDYNMPEVTGKELTEHIRGDSNQSHIPVLMVTSEANDTHLANIEQSGVNAMCDKPFEPEMVKAILYQLLDDH
ncbi:response regulator [Algicola sagamiensis]|uniref:response regulator n=1 Tax=Algicola sagamiensis TaxID=163869 RepID=UPI00035F3E72|nr:response regulator [Algicola sagamiensis]